MITTSEARHEVSVRKIDRILATTGVRLTSDAVQLAINHNIDIVFLSARGEPFARIWHPTIGGLTLVRRNQLRWTDNPEGLELVKRLAVLKIENQIHLLKKICQNRRRSIHFEINEYLERLAGHKEKITQLQGLIGDVRQKLLGFEGIAGRTYFEVLSNLLPPKFQFSGRSRQPAKDQFNAVINYGYGMLYSIVERACIIAGMDPQIGLFHVDQYNRPTFVYDIVEPFRIRIDEPTFTMFSKYLIKDEHFELLANGMRLSKDGKELVIDQFNQFFQKKVDWEGKTVTHEKSIQLFCYKLQKIFAKGKWESGSL